MREFFSIHQHFINLLNMSIVLLTKRVCYGNFEDFFFCSISIFDSTFNKESEC